MTAEREPGRNRRDAPHRHDLIANRCEPKPLLGEDGRGEAVMFPQQTKKQVFGPYPFVQEPSGFLRCVCEHVARVLAERNMACG